MDRMTPLLYAIDHNRINMVIVLLKYDADLCAIDQCKRNALHWIAIGNRIDMLKVKQFIQHYIKTFKL
jgi:ankyrin repeat protein